MSEKSIAVMGVGNILCRDEGLGVHIVQKLQDYDLPENVALIDAGTAFVDAFLDVSHAHKVIVVDNFMYKNYNLDVRNM